MRYNLGDILMSKLPQAFVEFKQQYKDVFDHYEALGTAAQKVGPLNQRDIALVRLSTAAGAKLEGAVHAHCRRAIDAGLTPDEIRHAIILQVTTLGFPSMMANLSRVNDVLNDLAQKQPRSE
jgi:4-carboxymuconolactone decarboxylase